MARPAFTPTRKGAPVGMSPNNQTDPLPDEREALETLRGLGYDEADARTLADHFIDAERRGRTGHGFSRVEWLATRPFELDPSVRPRRLVSEPGYERWDGNGALGYLTLAAIV